MILASSSPRRQEILKKAGFEPILMPQDIDETPHEGETPIEMVERLAKEKALACAFSIKEKDLIIAADTIVWLDDCVLGKPEDAQDAVRMLAMLSDKTHTVSTGVCIIWGDELRSFVDNTKVSFYELSQQEIDEYVATGDPLDKAGAYGYQSLGCTIVKGIEGDYFNVVGLPIGRVVREIAAIHPQA